MTPEDFPETNRIFRAPRDWDEERDGPCGNLHIRDTGDALISQWRPTLRERLRFLFGGSIRLWVIGRGQPPVALEVVK